MANTWKELRQGLNLTAEDEAAIDFEKELIRTMIKIRENQGLSQAQLAAKCKMKQPSLARMEKAAHSPQLDSFLRVLAPLGYTLKIEPLRSKQH